MLSSSYLETTVGKTLPLGLRNQYRIEGNDMLSDLLLSPRALNKDGSFMACESCAYNIAYSDSKVPQNLPSVMVGVLVKFQMILLMVK